MLFAFHVYAKIGKKMAPIQHVCERKMRRKPTKILKKKKHEFNE